MYIHWNQITLEPVWGFHFNPASWLEWIDSPRRFLSQFPAFLLPAKNTADFHRKYMSLFTHMCFMSVDKHVFIVQEVGLLQIGTSVDVQLIDRSISIAIPEVCTCCHNFWFWWLKCSRVGPSWPMLWLRSSAIHRDEDISRPSGTCSPALKCLTCQSLDNPGSLSG